LIAKAAFEKQDKHWGEASPQLFYTNPLIPFDTIAPGETAWLNVREI
jgi:hypothetical protein